MGASSIAWRTSVDYMKRSSIAGLSHAANSRSYVRSLYWLLVFVVGLALTVRSLANLVEEFLDYPVVTSSHLTTKPSVAFPAVTICNINRVNCVNLEEEALNLHKEGRLNESVKMVQFSIDIGCRAQVCNSVGITISGRREGPWLDSRAFAMGELGCKVHLEDKKLVNQMCYYYHTVKEYDEDVTAEAKAMAQKYWDEVGCEFEETCAFFSDEIGVVDEEEPEVGEMIGEECSQMFSGSAEAAAATTTTTTTAAPATSARRKRRRRKREDGNGDGDGDDAPFVLPDRLDESEFMSQYMAMGEDVRRRIGHHFEGRNSSLIAYFELKGMFAKCFYQGADCRDASLWHPSTAPNYGNCFTFNAVYNDQGDDDAPRNATLTGATNGLSLELFVDQLNYMTGALSERAGVRLIIHNPDSYPMADEFGLDVQPGSASSVSIHLNDISRLPHPHPSDCYDGWDQTAMDESLMSSGVRPRYAKAVCTRFCLQHEVMRACDCFHTQLEMALMNVTKFPFKNGLRPCDTAYGDSDNDLECVNEILENYSQEANCPSCHSACNETEYATSVTTSLWPSNRYWTDFALSMGFEAKDVFDSLYNTKLKQEIQQNYLKADVYFQTLNVREIVQSKKFAGDTIMASIGGGLSLYLGVAIILLFELFELGYDIFVGVWKHGSKTGMI